MNATVRRTLGASLLSVALVLAATSPAVAEGVGKIEGVCRQFCVRVGLLTSAGVPASVPTSSTFTTVLSNSSISAVPVTQGGTNQTSWARGDSLVFTAANTAAKKAIGSANTVWKSDGTDQDWGTLSSLIDGAFSSTRGSILYRGASGWAALDPGTDGYFLKAQGSGADPVWAAASGSSAESSCHAYRITSGVTVNNTTVTDVGLNAELWDTDSYHNTSSNTERMTFSGTTRPVTVEGSVVWSGDSAGYRTVYLRHYDSGNTLQRTVSLQLAPPGSAGWAQTLTAIFRCASGDYVTMQVYQDSGNTLTLSAHAQTHLTIVKH